MASDFFKKFVDGLGDDETSVASEGKSSAESSGFIDSGSYIFNAALSGSIYGGFPNNKAIVLAGDPATGKTFFALGMVKSFLSANPKARVFYFDTESAVTNEMMAARGIDTSRVAKSEPETIERFRTVAIKVLDTYMAIDAADRFPMLMVLDSLSALPSSKEVGDITEGKDTKDMTKPGLIKGAFRVLRLKMARAQVPFIVTNHIYSVIGAYVPTKEVAGGSGAKYAADTLVFLSKSKDKDDDKMVRGSVIKVRMVKSRLSREETKVSTRILFDGGLDRYYGLLEPAEAAGLVKKIANKYEFPDGRKAFEKAVLGSPEKYFTKDLLDKLDAALKPQFTYTADGDEPEDGGTDDDAE
jgi:RecA/RadA recombinase